MICAGLQPNLSKNGKVVRVCQILKLEVAKTQVFNLFL